MEKIIFWDFQGTLAYNDYMFSKVLYKIAAKDKTLNIKLEEFKDKQLIGFPWQNYKIKYEPKLWWRNAEKIFGNLYIEIGVTKKQAEVFSKNVREELLKGEDFELFLDARETLEYFKEKGYKNIILSNHIPELKLIIKKLGIDKYIDDCISSGEIGYEKPNINIFKYAKNKYSKADEMWMIGDNFLADIKGAEQVGIKAILVRAPKKKRSKILC